MKRSKLTWFGVVVVSWLLALSPDRAAAGSVRLDPARAYEARTREALPADHEELSPDRGSQETWALTLTRVLEGLAPEPPAPSPAPDDRYQPQPAHLLQTPVDRAPRPDLVPPGLRDITGHTRARQVASIAALVGRIPVDDRPRMAIEGSEPEIHSQVADWHNLDPVRLQDLEGKQPHGEQSHPEQSHPEPTKPVDMPRVLPPLPSRRDAATPAPRVLSVRLVLLPCDPDRRSPDHACTP